MDVKKKICKEDLIKVYGDEILNSQNETNRNISELRRQAKTAVWINGVMGVFQLIIATAALVLLLQLQG